MNDDLWLAAFSKLTKAQVNAMNHIAFNGMDGGRSGAPKTLAALCERGMLEAAECTSIDRLGAFTWTEYMMPIHVHMCWCRFVADQGDK